VRLVEHHAQLPLGQLEVEEEADRDQEVAVILLQVLRVNANQHVEMEKLNVMKNARI